MRLEFRFIHFMKHEYDEMSGDKRNLARAIKVILYLINTIDRIKKCIEFIAYEKYQPLG